MADRDRRRRVRSRSARHAAFPCRGGRQRCGAACRARADPQPCAAGPTPGRRS